MTVYFIDGRQNRRLDELIELTLMNQVVICGWLEGSEGTGPCKNLIGNIGLLDGDKASQGKNAASVDSTNQLWLTPISLGGSM